MELKCDICDGRLVVDKGGAVFCSQCGSVYTIAAMREKYQNMQEKSSFEETEEPSTKVIGAGEASKETIISKMTMLEELGDIDSAENMGIQYLLDNPNTADVRDEVEKIRNFKKSVKTAGTVLKGTVISIKEWGVFLEFYKGCEGMVHISQLCNKTIGNPTEVCKIGDELTVRCIGMDRMGRISYSAKDYSNENGF